MRYLEETSQIPVRVPFLRVAKLARPILLFGIFVVGTSLFLPQTGLSEVSTHPPRDLSETLTFNYSLAIGGSHPGLPTGNQSTQSLDQEPAPTQNISSLFINTQSSSSAYHSPYDEPLIEVQEQTPTVFPVEYHRLASLLLRHRRIHRSCIATCASCLSIRSAARQSRISKW